MRKVKKEIIAGFELFSLLCSSNKPGFINRVLGVEK